MIYCNPTAMIAAARYVENEYGFHGYQLGLASHAFAGVWTFEVRHLDGSEFLIAADKWGNVKAVPDGLDAERLAAFLQDIRRSLAEA